MGRRTLRSAAVVIALGVALGACGSDDSTTDAETDEAAVDREGDAQDDQALDDEGDLFDCSLEALHGEEPEFAFSVAYDVIGGELGAPCFGEEDAATIEAWEILQAIAPATQRSDIAIFGGFEPDGGVAEETLAFVNVLDADGTAFQMSVNTVDAVVDRDELQLTMAHEFTHVFTATPAQLDRTDEGVDECATYFNGEGCYLSDSLMMAWIGDFWDDDVLAGVDVTTEDADAADQRCFEDDGFFGPYAATNPEEDFAEAFSAFVFEVEPATDGQAERLDWITDQPGLREFRDNAVAAGMTPLSNNFDVCGP